MTNPLVYLYRMLAFLGAGVVVVAFLWSAMQDAFIANPMLNGLIILALLFGIVYICSQVLALNREINWIETFRTGRPGMSVQAHPRLLAPMATMLGDRTEKKFSMSAMAMRSLLDGISARLDERRENSRYLIGLLIFLGLLGTFWGLLQTIGSVADVISAISVGGGGDLGNVFNDLKKGLQAPLSGMGTAFSSSLFGLAGSLVLGFLDLQAGQAQNRFFNDLEDWLSGQTRLGSGTIATSDGGDSVPAFVQALLEQTADNMENLQRTLARGEESRISANTNISALTDRLSTLTDQMRTEQTLMVRIAESQLELKPILARLADATSGGGIGGDDGVRDHIRNLDTHMVRLLEDLSTGREELIQELRNEIRVLSRTLAAIAEQSAR